MLLKADPDQWFWLVLAILTVWRLTTLICYEAGPLHLISKLRALFYRIGLGSLIDCFHCAAVWVSVLVIAGLYKIGIASLFLVFAAAGGASIIEKILFYFTHPKEENNNENE